jgi:hypothetical protein
MALLLVQIKVVVCLVANKVFGFLKNQIHVLIKTASPRKKEKSALNVPKIMASLLVQIKVFVFLVTVNLFGFLNSRTFVIIVKNIWIQKIVYPWEKDKSAVYVSKIKD